ncbi:hypothetical protein B0H14DRAFT_3676164 [Mycena olivaceomarginata]|nr:hypothetical protein B0H14DRAFT_3676164 [Mycena olivaceomarginata]
MDRNVHAKPAPAESTTRSTKEGKERCEGVIESGVVLSPPPSFRLSWAAPSPAPSLCIPSSPSVHPCRAPAPPSPYKKKVKDYNLGSLIRTDARQEYGENNTIFGTLRAWSFLYVPFPPHPALALMRQRVPLHSR